MLDASSKIPSGLFSGNLIDLGSFDECVSIEHINRSEKIFGSYCKVQIPVNKIKNLVDLFSGNVNTFYVRKYAIFN